MRQFLLIFEDVVEEDDITVYVVRTPVVVSAVDSAVARRLGDQLAELLGVEFVSSQEIEAIPTLRELDDPEIQRRAEE